MLQDELQTFEVCLCRKVCSSVHLAQDDIYTAQNDDQVGNFSAFGHLTQTGQINKRWRPYMITPGIGGAVGDQVKAQFTFGAFHRAVGFARRTFSQRHWSCPERIGPSGSLFTDLLQDAQALTHLLHADDGAVVGVTVIGDRNVKVKVVVNAVGFGFAQVVRDAGGTQDRSGERNNQLPAGG